MLVNFTDQGLKDVKDVPNNEGAAQHIMAVQHLFCLLDSSRTSWDIAKGKGFKSGWHDK